MHKKGELESSPLGEWIGCLRVYKLVGRRHHLQSWMRAALFDFFWCNDCWCRRFGNAARMNFGGQERCGWWRRRRRPVHRPKAPDQPNRQNPEQKPLGQREPQPDRTNPLWPCRRSQGDGQSHRESGVGRKPRSTRWAPLRMESDHQAADIAELAMGEHQQVLIGASSIHNHRASSFNCSANSECAR